MRPFPALLLALAFPFAWTSGQCGSPQTTLDIHASAAVVNMIDDPVTGYNIASIESGGASGAIPVHNISLGIPIWQLRFFDGSATPHIVDPVSVAQWPHMLNKTADTFSVSIPAGGAGGLPGGCLRGRAFTWNYTFTSAASGLSSLVVVAMGGGSDSNTIMSNETIWAIFVTATLDSNSPLHSLEAIEFPRVAVGVTGSSGSARDKLFIPTWGGALVSNYTASNFSVGGAKEMFEPSALSTQQWGTYHTTASMSPLSYDFDISDSQLIMLGSRDGQGWTKGVKCTREIASQIPYLLWRGVNYPANNRWPAAQPGVTLTYNQIYASDFYLWSLGALPLGNDWSDLATYYRRWSTWAPRQYISESSPGTIQKITSGAIGQNVINSLLMLVYSPPAGTSGTEPCNWDWYNAMKPDALAWQALLQPLGLPAGQDGIIAFAYNHLYAPVGASGPVIVTQGMDQYVNASAPASTLTGRSIQSFRNEASALATLSGVNGALYTFEQGWDVSTPQWQASIATYGPNPPPAPPIDTQGTSPSCPTFPSCVSGLPAASGVAPELCTSYQVTIDPNTNSFAHTVDTCTNVWLMCPSSSAAYRNGVSDALYYYLSLLRSGTGPSSVIHGTYLDNMAAPGPLCYFNDYASTFSVPSVSGHQHASGGGRYWLDGRHRIAKDIRHQIRNGNGALPAADTSHFNLMEGVSEHWLEVSDLQGAYLNFAWPPDNGLIGNYFNVVTPQQGQWDIPASTRSGFRVTPVPFFAIVYGDYTYQYEIGTASPDMLGFEIGSWPHGAALDQSGGGYTNIAPGTTALHPGALVGWGVCLYNAYMLEAQSGPPTQNPFGCSDPIPYYSYTEVGIVSSSALSVADWDRLLWDNAYAVILPTVLDLNYKIQVPSYWYRGSIPLHPFHQNAPGLGAWVDDSMEFRMLKRAMKARSDWRSHVMLGPRLGQPLINPVGVVGGGNNSRIATMVSRVCPELRSASLGAAFGDGSTSPAGPIIIVENWMPWECGFDVYFDPSALGLSPTATINVTAFRPTWQGDPAGTPVVHPGTATSVTVGAKALRKFTASPIEAVGIRVFQLQ